MIIRPDSHASGAIAGTSSFNPLRLKRGTKVADMPSDAPPALSEIDSSFHLAEYLALKVRHDPHDIEGLVNLPEGAELRGTRGLKSRGSTRGNEGDEKNLWIYEHLRRIPIDLTPLVVLLLQSCTAESCPKMKADEWQYLCVAHGREGAEECSAIDYILHTLDSTTALLTSHDAFPSRIQIRAGSLEQFPSLFRRLSRIFSHAYYHHRETFHLAEAETSLYARFVALCEKYDLVGSNLLVIPRHVVADILDGKTAEPEIEVEEEDDDEDEEDEDEDEGDEERDSRSRDKGESGRRPHSLDRHARPHELGGWRQKGPAAAEGTVRGWSQVQPEQPAKAEEASEPPVSQASQDQDSSTASSSASVSTPAPSSISTASSSTGTTTNPDPVSVNTSQTYSLKPRPPKDGGKLKQHLDINKKEIGTLGRSTLGKKSRGTMLWTSEPSVPPTQDVPSVSTPTAETVGAPLERTESVETAILAPEDLEGDGPMPALAEGGGLPTGKEEAAEEEMPVPKDEIELLEEEGKLDIKAAVSLLPPTTPSLDTEAEVSSLPPTRLGTEAEASGLSLSPTTATATATTTTTKDTKAEDATTTSKDTTEEAEMSKTKPASSPSASTTTTQSTSTSKNTPTKSAKSSKPAIKAPSSILGTGTGSFVPPEVEKPKSSNSASSKGKSKSETSPKDKFDAALPTSKESAVDESEVESDKTDTVEKGV